MHEEDREVLLAFRAKVEDETKPEYDAFLFKIACSNINFNYDADRCYLSDVTNESPEGKINHILACLEYDDTESESSRTTS